MRRGWQFETLDPVVGCARTEGHQPGGFTITSSSVLRLWSTAAKAVDRPAAPKNTPPALTLSAKVFLKFLSRPGPEIRECDINETPQWPVGRLHAVLPMARQRPGHRPIVTPRQTVLAGGC